VASVVVTSDSDGFDFGAVASPATERAVAVPVALTFGAALPTALRGELAESFFGADAFELSDVECDDDPDDPVSAYATAVPPIIAAPSPAVSVPAASQAANLCAALRLRGPAVL
jgi:hypothetical protein